jgi:periplasmic divalent cation tolerance protein
MKNKLIIFYVTFPDYSTALEMANSLIKNKLAGCCNIIPGVHSVYLWNERIENSQEFVMIIKTVEEKSDELVRFIESKHPYEVPCILRINDGNINSSYYEWIKKSME